MNVQIVQNLVEFIKNLFGGNIRIATVVLSMFPLIELKGGIPVAVAGGLPQWEAFIWAFIGSSLVILPMLYLFIPFLKLLKKIPLLDKLALKIDERFEVEAEKIQQKANAKSKKARLGNAENLLAFSLFLFVAIPLPFTGVWSGCAVAGFCNIPPKKSFLPIVLGNLIAGLIFFLLVLILGDYVQYIILALIIIIIAIISFFIIKAIFSKKKQNAEVIDSKEKEKSEEMNKINKNSKI